MVIHFAKSFQNLLLPVAIFVGIENREESWCSNIYFYVFEFIKK